MTTRAARTLSLTPYRPSGAFSRRVFVYGAGVCLVAALGAWAHHNAAVHAPDPNARLGIWGVFLVKVAAFIVLDIACLYALTLARARSTLIGTTLGIVAALCFLVASHALAAARASREGAPAGIVENTRFRLAKGQKVIHARGGQYTARGGSLVLHWGLEALCFFGAGAAVGLYCGRLPFCERCGKYATAPRWESTLAHVSPAGIRALRNATSIDELTAPDLDPRDEAGCPVEFAAEHCTGCGHLVVLRVTTIETQDKQSPRRRDRTLHRALLLDPERENALLNGLHALRTGESPHAEPVRRF